MDVHAETRVCRTHPVHVLHVVVEVLVLHLRVFFDFGRKDRQFFRNRRISLLVSNCKR